MNFKAEQGCSDAAPGHSKQVANFVGIPPLGTLTATERIRMSRSARYVTTAQFLQVI